MGQVRAGNGETGDVGVGVGFGDGDAAVAVAVVSAVTRASRPSLPLGPWSRNPGNAAGGDKEDDDQKTDAEGKLCSFM